MSSAHELKLVVLLYEVILCLWGNREWYCNKIMKDFLNTWGPNWLAIELSNFIFAPIADLLVKGIYPTVEILKAFDCGKHRGLRHLRTSRESEEVTRRFPLYRIGD